jgi:hypothetical protein
MVNTTYQSSIGNKLSDVSTNVHRYLIARLSVVASAVHKTPINHARQEAISSRIFCNRSVSVSKSPLPLLSPRPAADLPRTPAWPSPLPTTCTHASLPFPSKIYAMPFCRGDSSVAPTCLTGAGLFGLQAVYTGANHVALLSSLDQQKEVALLPLIISVSVIFLQAHTTG